MATITRNTAITSWKQAVDFALPEANLALLPPDTTRYFGFVADGYDKSELRSQVINFIGQELKKEFGDRIVFWGGGCDTQKVLGTATPEEIRGHVKERINIFAPGGGYVFNQIHNIQANVPTENIMAVLDAACEYGKY